MVRSLIPDLKAEFGGDKRFKVLLKGVKRMGGPNDSLLNLLPYKDEHHIINSFARILSPEISVVNLENSYVHAICYASMANSFAIRADGRVAKCTVALNDERNHVGMLRENGTILFDRERLMPWLRGLESLNDKEL